MADSPDVGAVRDQLTQIADAATPGPWIASHPDQCCEGICVAPIDGAGGLHDMYGSYADQKFAAAARTAVPALVGALQAVLAIHTQSNHPSPLPKLCHGCNGWWPCPTVRAVTENLGGAL